MIFNIRERLEFVAKAPGMCAVTREGILCQVMATLALVGIDPRSLERIGVASDVPASVVPLDHLLARVKIPLDPWVSDLVTAALALLPEGPAIYSIKSIGA